ncbi:hypothetical protein [Corynebacterium hindlerae]|uniref:hypothetical protein n=1 Tax=Corynebacterium hindlerae TaxID=699041 RepID=UPI0031B697EA
MKSFPDNLDLFTVSGAVLTAFASIATIGLAINEALSAGRLERKILRVKKILEGETNPGRMEALKEQELQLEAALFSKEAIPIRQTWFVVLALSFPMARILATAEPDAGHWSKLITQICLALGCFTIVDRFTYDLLRREVSKIRYLSGQNPYLPINDESRFHLSKTRSGFFFNLIIATNLWTILNIILYITWKGWTPQQVAYALLSMLTLNAFTLIGLPKDLKALMEKLSLEYASQWRAENSQQVEPDHSKDNHPN